MSKSKKNNKDRVNTYIKFSSIAIQMGLIITAGALGGDWLDERQGNEFPIWTLVLTLIAIFSSLYKIIKAVIKLSKDEDNSEG